MRFHVLTKLPSLANTRMSWQAMASLKKKQRKVTALSLAGKEIPSPPLVVTITRVGPSKLDDDNLASACKYIRDQIAKMIGIDDGSSLYTWQYRQRIERGRPQGAEVEIIEREWHGKKESNCTE